MVVGYLFEIVCLKTNIKIALMGHCEFYSFICQLQNLSFVLGKNMKSNLSNVYMSTVLKKRDISYVETLIGNLLLVFEMCIINLKCPYR